MLQIDEKLMNQCKAGKNGKGQSLLTTMTVCRVSLVPHGHIDEDFTKYKIIILESIVAGGDCSYGRKSSSWYWHTEGHIVCYGRIDEQPVNEKT